MPLIIAALIGCALAVHTVRKRRIRYGALLCALAALIFVWLTFYVLELLLPGEASKRLMLDLQYFAIPYISPVFFIYVRCFSGAKPFGAVVAALFILPVCASLACWTNVLHGLFYTPLGINTFGIMSVPARSYNVLFYINIAYSALLLLMSGVRLISHYARLHKTLRRQLALLLFAVLPPALCGAVGLALSSEFSLVPVALVISVYLLIWLMNDYTFRATLPEMRDACFELSDAALFQIDAERRVLDMNAAAALLTQKRPDELIMHDLAETLEKLSSGPRLAFSGDEELHVSRGAADASYTVHTTPIGGSTVVTIRDIGEQKREEERQSYFANFDSLTALPNRGLFFKLLRRELDHNKRYGEVLTLLAIDVDSFHEINELYGYQVGDRVLLELSKRLIDSLRKADTISRFEDDEFYIILPKLNAENTPAVIERLLAVLSAPVKVGNDQIEVTFSVGATRSPDDTGEADELLALARTAMRSRQPKTRNSYRMYMPGIEDDAYRVEDDLKQALESGAVQCDYLPIEDGSGAAVMLQGRVVSVSDSARELFPGHLLAAYTPEVELHLMHLLLGDYRARFAEGPILLLPFGQRLLRPDFVTHFCQSLRQFGYDRSGIALLLNPAALSSRNDEERTAIMTLREAGAKLVLDGFEANHSLTRLTVAIEIEYARLSKSLVENIHEKPSLLLTESAVCVAQRAGVAMHAIAPDEAAAEQLRAAGIDWIGMKN